MSARATALRVAFVTHGGPAIGLGHVARCLALAGAWAADGAEIAFVVSPDAQVAERLYRAAADLRRRAAAAVEVLELGWEADAARARERLARLGADIVVVDSYAASADFLASLATVAGQVVAVDDLAARPLPVPVVVNGGIAAETLPYDRASDTLFLLGPRYALVDPRFAEPVARRGRSRVERVLVALGGGRQTETVETALRAVDAVLDGAQVDVVVGPFAPAPSDADARHGAPRNRRVVHRDPLDLRELMLAADLAVSGAGVTLYELAATATPTVIVQMADNQAPNASGFERAGAALSAGRAGHPELGSALTDALRRLVADASLRQALGGRARELVDGAGALRVAREVGARVTSRRGRGAAPVATP